MSIGARIIVGDPHQDLNSYLKVISNKINIDVLVGFEDDRWIIKKGDQSFVLSLSEQQLKFKPREVASLDKPSFYILTSGSTGAANLVALSEYAFINHIVRESDDMGPEHTCSYGCAPLNHIFGLALYLQHLLMGKTIYISNSRNPALALDIIEKYRCSAIGNVPTFFNMLIEEQNKKPRDISSFKYGVIAGGGYSKEQFLNIQDKLGISRYQLEKMCPKEYYCDYIVWLCNMSECVSIWEHYIVCSDKIPLTDPQKDMIERLQKEGLLYLR